MPQPRRRPPAGTVALLLLLVVLVGCGGGSRRPDRATAPTASPASEVTGPRSFLYLVSPSGGAPRPLFSVAEAARLVSISDPVWSPDGRRIAFTAGCATCLPRLYVVSSTGRDLREIRTGAGGALSPGWSPRGNAIVFARQRGEQQFVVAVDLRTDHVRLINGEPEGADNTDSTPSWSPDGRRIVFAREVHHEDVTLWLVRAAGAAPQPLIPGSRAFDQTHPRWSPDGRRIVFMQAVTPAITWNLYILDVANGRLRTLTSDPGNEFDPAWAPDGKSIVFASDSASKAGFRSLYVIRADGSGLRRLTDSSADDSMPSWSPDGKEIVFVRRPTMKA